MTSNDFLSTSMHNFLLSFIKSMTIGDDNDTTIIGSSPNVTVESECGPTPSPGS